MSQVITVRDNQTGAYIRIPVTPETFDYSDGDKQADTVQIINLGAVDVLHGVELDEISWESFFPVVYDPSYCSHPNIHSPLTYRNIFSTWKDSGTSLQIVFPEFGLNKTMYVKSFTWSPEGYDGSIAYKAIFRGLKTISPKPLSVGQSASDKDEKVPADRPAASESEKPATYTVKSGDTLTNIAKRLGIADWKTIYDANKKLIGADYNVIQAGQVLTIP